MHLRYTERAGPVHACHRYVSGIWELGTDEAFSKWCAMKPDEPHRGQFFLRFFKSVKSKGLFINTLWKILAVTYH